MLSGERMCKNDTCAHGDLQCCCDATQSRRARKIPKALKPGDLVSIDIFTSKLPHRAGGQTRVMCFTDRYSSRQKLYLLHDESEEHAMLDMYINWCASRGVTVKRLHMDNEPKEHNEPMQRVLKAHKLDGALFYGALFYGALSTTSAGVETDRLNGRMRPLEESTRTLIVRANLPYSFWWYAMCHSPRSTPSRASRSGSSAASPTRRRPGARRRRGASTSAAQPRSPTTASSSSRAPIYVLGSRSPHPTSHLWRRSHRGASSWHRRSSKHSGHRHSSRCRGHSTC